MRKGSLDNMGKILIIETISSGSNLGKIAVVIFTSASTVKGPKITKVP